MVSQIVSSTLTNHMIMHFLKFIIVLIFRLVFFLKKKSKTCETKFFLEELHRVIESKCAIGQIDGLCYEWTSIFAVLSLLSGRY